MVLDADSTDTWAQVLACTFCTLCPIARESVCVCVKAEALQVGTLTTKRMVGADLDGLVLSLLVILQGLIRTE